MRWIVADRSSAALRVWQAAVAVGVAHCSVTQYRRSGSVSSYSSHPLGADARRLQKLACSCCFPDLDRTVSVHVRGNGRKVRLVGRPSEARAVVMRYGKVRQDCAHLGPASSPVCQVAWTTAVKGARGLLLVRT